MMENKRRTSDLIPYKVKGDEIFVFLQKRAKDAKRLPDMFSFFGGGVEGNESPEETLKREIKEELNLVLDSVDYFKKYEFDDHISDVFFMKVGDDFESKITVLEGEYGKWFNEQETVSESRLITPYRIMLHEFFEFLRASNNI